MSEKIVQLNEEVIYVQKATFRSLHNAKLLPGHPAADSTISQAKYSKNSLLESSAFRLSMIERQSFQTVQGS